MIAPPHPRCLPLVAAWALASPVVAQDADPAMALDTMVQADLSGIATGVVAGVVIDGQIDLLDAWGRPALESADSLTVDRLFAYPGMTEMLVAVTVRAVAASGLVDPGAPLATYLPETSGRLARVTLDQLLSHTGGLHDGVVENGDWRAALDGLDDEAFIAEPGDVYSRSRFSYPLAARVLERLLGGTFAEIATRAVLTPLAMERSTFHPDTARERGLAVGYRPGEEGPVPVAPVPTLGGLPVLYTTAADVLQFLDQWMAGGIRGSTPVGNAPAAVPRLDPSRHFGDGLVQDAAALVPQAWANHQGAGFGASIHLYPEARTALVVWSNGAVPRNTLFWVRRLVAQAVGDMETAMASEGVRVTRSVDPSLRPDGLDDLSEWAGLYRNGPALVGLRFIDERLWLYDGERDLPLQGIAPATFAYRGEEGGGPPLQLVRLGERRAVLFGERAYAWESAEIPGSGR